MKTVLVVEDEAELAEVIVELLRDEGYRVISAGSLEEAEAKLNAGFEPDVAVVDISLPDGSAWSLIPRIRSANADARVVVVTGLGAILDPAETSSADAVLAKPFSIDELLQAIEPDATDKR